MAIIDLLAFLPFYLPFLTDFDLRFIRAIRLFRLFRILKLVRYSNSIRTIGNVFRQKKEELTISIIAVFLVLLFASTLIYFLERNDQPKMFASIPDAMWWAVVTLTTVGYGDIYPITPLGKVFGALIALLGIGVFALPTGILVSGFFDEMSKKRAKSRKCPHCGGDITTSE